LKKTLLILFSILYSSLQAQEIKIFESKNVVINASKEFNPKKIYIGLSNALEPLKNTFLLSENVEDYIKVFGAFPKEKGFYFLLIEYEYFIYREVLWYKTSPENEKLVFNFYKSENRVLCKIESEECTELNKEVILYKLTPEEWKKLLDTSRKKHVHD
jgi:hypothetical protein